MYLVKEFNKDLEFKTSSFNKFYPTSKAVYTASKDLENEFSFSSIEKIDTENYLYLATSKTPKFFSKTSKSGKIYTLYMWKFDNVENPIFVPEFKNVVISNSDKKIELNLIILDKKLVDVKNIEEAAVGVDDFIKIDNVSFFKNWKIVPLDLPAINK